MKPPTQRQLADSLARELRECGHEDISDYDILDCLASLGLRLGREESTATVHYLDRVREGKR